MRRLSPIILAVILVAPVAGCRTGEPVETSEAVTASAPVAPIEPRAQGQEAPSPARPECPVADTVCPTELSPTFCSADAYAGRTLKEGDALVAWGHNVCQGRLNLAREACRREMKPSRLGRSQCVPDASNGSCPVLPPVCTTEYAPTRCVARGYGDQALSDAAAVRATGGNPCSAQAKLREAACRRNLDPKRLSEIGCTPDPTGGECQVPERDDGPACNDGAQATVCRATESAGASLPQPLEAKGTTPCEAKKALARLACSREMKPSGLGGVTCEAIGK